MLYFPSLQRRRITFVCMLGMFIGTIGTLCGSFQSYAETPETYQAGVYWSAEKARAIAFRHLERQIKPHFFETQHKAYFESVKACQENPDLKFAKCQTTTFPDGAYSQAFEGEKLAYYYKENGVLFKVSVCDKPFGKDYNYPRRCVEYGFPEGRFQTISLDVSPDESYIYDLHGELLQHWKDGQGFSPTESNTWERSRPDED
jgi:hypothetical protein